MKRSLLVMILGFSALAGTSQINVHVGVNSGVNTMLLLDEGINTKPQYVTVNNINFAPFGVSFGVDFSNKFGIQLETIRAMYDMVYKLKKQQQEIGELRFQLEYIQIPMLLKFMNGSNKQARLNFAFGPQLSILTAGYETLTLYEQAAGEKVYIPDSDPNATDGGILNDLPPGTTNNGDGTYVLPDPINEKVDVELLSTVATGQYDEFKNQELHIVGGIGLDVDISPKLYISMFVKGDYGLTDMRNGDLIAALEQNTNLQSFTERRATLSLGVQFSIHYMFNGTRFFLKAIN